MGQISTFFLINFDYTLYTRNRTTSALFALFCAKFLSQHFVNVTYANLSHKQPRLIIKVKLFGVYFQLQSSIFGSVMFTSEILYRCACYNVTQHIYRGSAHV